MIRKVLSVLFFVMLVPLFATADERTEDAFNQKLRSVWQSDCASCHVSGRSLATKTKNKTIVHLSDFIKSGDTTHRFVKKLSDEEIKALATYIVVHRYLTNLEKLGGDK